MEKLLLVAGVALISLVLIGPEGGGDATIESAPEAADMPASASPPSPAAPAPAPARAGNGISSQTLRRGPDGHFYADARINGSSARMMIDTGASIVVLSRDDARAAGIRISQSGFTARGQTAGGEIALHPVTINRLALGPLVARDVPAMVAENDLPISLLGQSFLSRVGHVEIAGDEMRLR